MTINRVISILCTACILAVPAGAQERDTTAADSTGVRLIVTPEGEIQYELAPMVVTGARLPLTRDELGFPLSVVSAEELSSKPVLYAADILRTQPGSSIDEATGPGGPAIIRLRGGEEVFTQVLMDGVQINRNGGYFDFQGVTLSNVERVEVARGPQSAVYGSSAVSGVVNFITRRGTPDQPYVEILSEAGVHPGPGTDGRGGSLEPGGRFRTAISAGGGTGRLGYSVGLGHTYNRGIYALPHNTWTRDASLRLDAALTDRWQLTGMARFVGVDTNHPVRDPGVSRAPLDPNAEIKRNRIMMSLGTNINPNGRWQHRLKTSAYRNRLYYDDLKDDVAETGTYDFFIFDANFTLRSILWRTTAEYVSTAFLRPPGDEVGLNISYGAQWEREELADSTAGDFGSGMMKLDRSSGAVFAEAQLELLHRVSLLAGGRIEKFEGLNAEFTPRASAVVEVVPDLVALRSTVGRAYKTPNLQEQFLENPFIASNPDLKAETSWSREIGANIQSRDGAFQAGLTLFHQDYDNLIRSVGLEGSDPPRQINRNLGESRVFGLEWDARYRAPRPWSAGFSGWWIKTEILENTGLSSTEFPVGEALPSRPRYQSSAYVDFPVNERFDLTVRGTIVGPQVVLTERFSGQRVNLDTYLLMGLNLGLQASPAVRLYARIDNLFNTKYEAAFDRRGIPLTFSLGARIFR